MLIYISIFLVKYSLRHFARAANCIKRVRVEDLIQIATMESDTTEIESTAAAAAESQTPQQSESVVGGKGEAKVEGDATPPPHKRQKIEKDDDAEEDADEPKEKQIEESEEQVPQLVAVERAQSSLRKFNRIPVFIVDYHNDVLEFIYRCLATRHLPLERNVLVHFDSHPDLVVDRDIPASASYDKDVMLNELSIENWIMPTLYAGKTKILTELVKREKPISCSP